ncbi:hypothetical protein [Sporomusa acidovorans]|uniref:hypothetical protein n=1 Tax=Sporomusa acidovorans TaxID=112900 RepID=UPI001160B96E|nr:hypothetical protein [Sporomusa acidovorans]
MITTYVEYVLTVVVNMTINKMNAQCAVLHPIWVQWIILTTILPLILMDSEGGGLDFSRGLDSSHSSRFSFRSSSSDAAVFKMYYSK